MEMRGPPPTRSPLEKIYLWALRCHRACTTAQKLPALVISVGNVALGGRAKTPLVISIVNLLKEKGWAPVVLTRGYKRKIKESRWLLPGEPSLPATEAGDEPLEIFLRTQVPVLVGANRLANARSYLKEHGHDKQLVFVLDDGFQHWQIARDLDVVVIDPSDFSARTLPTGTLREEPDCLKRADVVLELGRELQKISIVPEEIYALSASGKKALAITTRAGKQRSYFEGLAHRKVSLISCPLRDHADCEDIYAAMSEQQGWDYLLVGWKEAVKILSAADMQRLSQAGVVQTHLLNYPNPSRLVTVALVSLDLDWNKENFLSTLKQKVMPA